MGGIYKYAYPEESAAADDEGSAVVLHHRPYYLVPVDFTAQS